MTKIHIEPQTGAGFELAQGELLKVIDTEGEQVADLFAFSRGDTGEWLSSGRSIDYNGTIHLTQGHVLYSNRSNPMFTIVADTVGKHDFLFAPCSREMFKIQYGITEHHPNCLDNLTGALGEYGIDESMITIPFNIFMNARVLPDGSIEIAPALSQPSDYITFRAEMDLCVAVAACSAGKCNNNQCTCIDIEISP